MTQDKFNYIDERFADLQLLHYRVNGFEKLTLQQKCMVYCLAKATLYGRDITFDQQGAYNLRIRRLLETIYEQYQGDRESSDFKAFEVYLKRVWFSNGIYHHYGCEKIAPGFPMEFLLKQKEECCNAMAQKLKAQGKDVDMDALDKGFDELMPVIFDMEMLPKRVNKAAGDDLVVSSACNFYSGVTQAEAEEYYSKKKSDERQQPSWGLNSTLVKRDGEVVEDVWKADGRYGEAIKKICMWLKKAEQYAENLQQKDVIDKLVRYYETGDLRDFDDYSIEWVKCQDGKIDFINGFIEVYGDPLALKGTWEGIVEIQDEEATKRTQTISNNAQWFEDHSPVDKRFKKSVVKGVTAKAIEAAMLGGEEYPSSAIGINLPNADWIRAEHGSKSVTITNLTHAYDEAAAGNGFDDEFIDDPQVRQWVKEWGSRCDDLHTDLHECLGHGSGQLLEGVDPDSLKAYGNTIEEARADLFGLYYIADRKMVELGLLSDEEAYKSQYYKYMLNGLMTQLVRITPGQHIEEAHMRNRALIARWALSHGNDVVALEKVNGKTFLRINDYERLRDLFAQLLAEVQRIKSEGDYEAARELVENYAVKVDETLHQEVLSRYEHLNIAPYKGFVNPRLTVVENADGKVADITIDYSETYTSQMLRYSKEYATLI